jgi:hypothetical protein
MSYTNGITKSFKAYRETKDDSITTSTWTDCSGFTTITSETQGNVAVLNVDDKTVEILQDGFYIFGGCVYTQNISESPQPSVTILCRVLKNKAGGGEELKCSLRGQLGNIVSGGESSLDYSGTAILESGDTLNLQYFTDNANIVFVDNLNFDNTIAYTIWLVRVGDFD